MSEDFCAKWCHVLISGIKPILSSSHWKYGIMNGAGIWWMTNKINKLSLISHKQLLSTLLHHVLHLTLLYQNVVPVQIQCLSLSTDSCHLTSNWGKDRKIVFREIVFIPRIFVSKNKDQIPPFWNFWKIICWGMW